MNDAAVAELFIAALENGTAPWIRPWDASMPDGSRPFNPTSGKTYKGINTLILSAQGLEDPRWLTYKQASALGAQVRRGARSVHITYWAYEKEQRDPVTGLIQIIKLDKPKPIPAFLFNATEHIDGLPPYERPAIGWDPLVRADDLVASSGVYVTESSGDKAMYSPWLDQITMPFRHQFSRAEHWASTLLHEFSHATGHVSRLGRDQTGTFDSESYAREELIAEIGSYMLCTELAISTPGLDAQHAAYVGSWIKALKSDPKEIFRAAAAAQRVFNFAMEFDRSPQLREAQEEARKIQPAHQAEPMAPDHIASRRSKTGPRAAQEMTR